MSLPDVSQVLNDWVVPVTIKTVTKATVDFVATNVVTSRSQDCVIQVADKSKLNSKTINWNLRYLMVHSKSAIEMSEYITFDGEDYKVIEKGNWTSYGYIEVVAEQTRKPLLVVTP